MCDISGQPIYVKPHFSYKVLQYTFFHLAFATFAHMLNGQGPPLNNCGVCVGQGTHLFGGRG